MRFALIAFCIAVVFPATAYAYIDPNTGGLVFQMGAVVFGSLLAIVYFLGNHISRFFKRIMRIFRKQKKDVL